MHLKHRSKFTAKIFSIVFYTFIVNVHIFTSLKEKNNLEAIYFASQSAVCFELWRLGKCQWSVTGQDFHGFKTFDWLGFVHSFRPHLSNISFFLLLFLSFSLSLGCFYFGFSGLFVHFEILPFVRSLLSVQLKSTYVCKNENEQISITWMLQTSEKRLTTQILHIQKHSRTAIMWDTSFYACI